MEASLRYFLPYHTECFEQLVLNLRGENTSRNSSDHTCRIVSDKEVQNFVDQKDKECPICLSALAPENGNYNDESEINNQDRKLALCPYSLNKHAKYTHGMCLICAQQLLNTTVARNIESDCCECPVCRKPISLPVLDEEGDANTILDLIYQKERREGYTNLAIKTLVLPAFVASAFAGPPQSLKKEIVRGVCADFILLPSVVVCGIAGYFAGSYAAEYLGKAYLALKSYWTHGRAPANNNNTFIRTWLPMLAGGTLALVVGTYIPMSLLDSIALPRRSPARQFVLDLSCSLATYLSRRKNRRLLKQKCFSQRRAMVKDSSKRLELVSMGSVLCGRILVPTCVAAVVGILHSVRQRW
eukprot:GEZU01003964.1.p1 GENE.GEZU01003964.1~~GEZU01003964.1.p1  ORF type:complete len:371 (-),score=63.51 GEZU01003964.1:103-1173(-)